MADIAEMLTQQIQCIIAAEIHSLTLPQSRELMSNISRIRSFLDLKEAQVASHVTELTSESGPAMAELEMGLAGRLSKRESKNALARGAVFAESGGFADALQSGRVTGGHVDALAAALKKLPEDQRGHLLAREGDLVRRAASENVDAFAKHLVGVVARARVETENEAFERQRRSSYFKHWTDAEGMVQLRGALDPERGEVLIGRLSHAVEALFHSLEHQNIAPQAEGVDRNDHLRAHALMNLTDRGAHHPDTPGPQMASWRCDVSVIVDLDTLRAGLHEKSVCRTESGTHLPVEVVRRMACEADVMPVVLNGDGVPIDVGRAKRLATRAQRKALAAIHDSCGIPGCTVPFVHCVPHHIEYWENGGQSDFNNLLPLCSRHHHAAHEGGWKIVLGCNRSVTVTLPDGRVLRE